jgi:hypothetical protein
MKAPPGKPLSPSYFVEFALGYTNSEQKSTASQTDPHHQDNVRDELPSTLQDPSVNTRTAYFNSHPTLSFQPHDTFMSSL